MKQPVLGVGSSIPHLQSDGGALVTDPAGKSALTGSSLWMLTGLFPIIAGPSLIFVPLGPEGFVGASRFE